MNENCDMTLKWLMIKKVKYIFPFIVNLVNHKTIKSYTQYLRKYYLSKIRKMTIWFRLLICYLGLMVFVLIKKKVSRNSKWGIRDPSNNYLIQ